MAATASQDAAPAGEPMNESGGWLDPSWVVLPAETLPGLPGEPRAGERRFVLLHPAHGIAILDLWSSVAALPELEVAAALDAELALAGFLRRHDPRLPVRRIYLAQEALPQLAGVVARAYAGASTLNLPEAWIDAVRGTLAVPQKPAGRAAWRMPRLRMAGRYRLAAGIALLLTAGVVGLLAAGGHVIEQRAQPVADAANAPGRTASATPPLAASAGPLAARAAIAPPAAAGPPPATPPDPVRAAAAPAPPAARAASAPPAAADLPSATLPDPARAAAAPAPLEPALSPATSTASAGPPAARAAIAPPPASEPLPEMPPDPARTAEAAVEEDATDRPVAAPPRPVRRQARPVRRAAPARYSQGWVPNSGGSFIRQQSLQYATGNGS
jgi:hypothetical protein